MTLELPERVGIRVSRMQGWEGRNGAGDFAGGDPGVCWKEVLATHAESSKDPGLPDLLEGPACLVASLLSA